MSEPRLSTPSLLVGGPVTPAFRELRAGHLGVRLAINEEEINAAQMLRYQVFYEEMGAKPDSATLALKLDRDEFDAIADHLLVIDHDLGEGTESVVGTYRLIREEAAAKFGRFYSESEYDISPLTKAPLHKLELGRSCTAKAYRNRMVMQLLWRGIAAYVFHHSIDLMFGCASLSGTDPDALAEELAYLALSHTAPADICPTALPARYVNMKRMTAAEIDPKRALMRLPPLVKGYLRLGGFVGDGAVIDRQFNTTDIAIIVRTDMITAKYYRHYERDAR